MKKIYAIVAFAAIASSLGAQSQRLVLAEEFTQASCGPCAAANPAFNSLLNTNNTKVISLKYQVNWPGVDPMNAQYATAVQSRVNYYGLNSVPYALLDGTACSGSSYLGYPGNCTQTKINTEYAVASPFTMEVSHTLNTAQDSIFITVHATCTQAFTSVSYLRLHTILIEKHIHFTSAPGSNGETDFYNVVRKMIPTQGGAGLLSTWAVGQDTTFTFAVKIPTYIYDIDQLAVVSFIQDNGNKQVEQAGYSISPVGIYNYVNAPSSINLFPNPANDNATLRFTLDQSSGVVVNIYNALGELVSTENQGVLGAGEHNVPLSIEMLAAGMYTVELVADKNRSVSQLNVVR